MENSEFLLNAFLDACRLIAKYNPFTNQLYIIKDENGIHYESKEPIDAKEYANTFIEKGTIYQEDSVQFEHLFDETVMQNLCETHQNGSLIVYRRILNGKLIWSRLNMFVPQSFSIDNPYVVVFNRDMPSSEAMIFEAWGLLGEQIHKVVKANLTTDEFTTLKEYPSEKSLRKKSHINTFSGEMAFLKNSFVHKDDALTFERHLDHAYICNYFREGNSEYQFYYRRKVRGLYRWVRLTILPASEYSHGEEVFYYYISDVHKTILKLLDIRAATRYAHYFAGKDKSFSEGYYENLLEILSTFTQSYLDYYMIDLTKDLYINYKLDHNRVNSDIPYIGNYTQTTQNYLLKNYSGKEAEFLQTFSSSTKLQELLKDKLTLEYTFTYPTGIKVTTTCVKIGSKNGVPTKVLCSTIPVKMNNKLVIRTFGNFEVLNPDGTMVHFSRKQSKQLLAYLVDRQGYPVTSKDIVVDILEKNPQDLNAIKYVSTLIRRAIQELENAGYTNVIIKETKSIRINSDAINCDYYELLKGNTSYWTKYHNEYMKEYSWAEETNAEIQDFINVKVGMINV